MDTDIWLPLATLVLGWAGAQVTEVLRDRRTTTRERLARRAELQRTTLLGLQEGLAGVWRGFLGTVALVGLEEEEHPSSGPLAPLTQASRDFAATRARVKLLASRVEDQRARELATLVVKASIRGRASVQVIQPVPPELATFPNDAGAETAPA
jgi:hypothetical protein